MAARTGSAVWNGTLGDGDGELTVGESVFTGPYSFSSRFEDGAGTNPEELIAAAHAGCFSMALSKALADAGHEPQRIQTRAGVQLRQVDGLPTITSVALEVEVSVPGLDEAALTEHAEAAKKGCVVSRALAGVDEITVTARLS